MFNILRNKSVLLLEDNVEFSSYFTEVLENFFITIHTSNNINKARDLYNSENIDIIISDIRLRKENGFEFIKEIRAINSSIPVIILSGHKDEEFLFSAINLKLTAYLLKPVKYNDLLDALHQCASHFNDDKDSKVQLNRGWVYDSTAYTLEHAGEVYPLNKKESLFFDLFSQNPNRIVTKEMISQYVWDDLSVMSDSALKNFIFRMRKKLGKDIIYTISNLGYQLHNN